MIHIAIPGLPPTDNNAYFNLVKGKGKKKSFIRALTEEGRRYKTETTAYIVSHYPTEIRIFKPNMPYGYIVQLFFPNLLNKTWPDDAQNRYKRLDVINRSKLFQDAFAEACGVDDSVFLSCRYDKAEGEEYTHIYVWNMEEEFPYGGNVR